jgi:hypothetical protein
VSGRREMRNPSMGNPGPRIKRLHRSGVLCVGAPGIAKPSSRGTPGLRIKRLHFRWSPLCRGAGNCEALLAGDPGPKNQKTPLQVESSVSGRRELNPGPLAPHASALAGLRHAPPAYPWSFVQPRAGGIIALIGESGNELGFYARADGTILQALQHLLHQPLFSFAEQFRVDVVQEERCGDALTALAC